MSAADADNQTERGRGREAKVKSPWDMDWRESPLCIKAFHKEHTRVRQPRKVPLQDKSCPASGHLLRNKAGKERQKRDRERERYERERDGR